MHRLLNILIIATAILTMLIIGHLVYSLITSGFDNGQGMAIVVLQLFGAILSSATLGLGIITFILAKYKHEYFVTLI